MEDNKILTETEEEVVTGGSAAAVADSAHRCVSCGSKNVTVTLRKLRNGAKMVVGSCNDCGHAWSFPLPQ